MQKFVVVDADILVTLSDPQEKNYTEVVETYEELKKKNVIIFFPITALCEAVTVLHAKRVRRGVFAVTRPDEAIDLASKALDNEFPFLPVDEDILTEALKIYKENDFAHIDGGTLFDAIITTIALQSQAAIFSFDSIYRRMPQILHRKLKLAQDIFR